jgi:hypothetical protein
MEAKMASGFVHCAILFRLWRSTRIRLLQPYVARGSFSHWIAQVFGDYPLAQTIRHIEGDRTRCGEQDVREQIGLAIRTRYQFLVAEFLN